MIKISYISTCKPHVNMHAPNSSQPTQPAMFRAWHEAVAQAWLQFPGGQCQGHQQCADSWPQQSNGGGRNPDSPPLHHEAEWHDPPLDMPSVPLPLWLLQSKWYIQYCNLIGCHERCTSTAMQTHAYFFSGRLGATGVNGMCCLQHQKPALVYFHPGLCNSCPHRLLARKRKCTWIPVIAQTVASFPSA